MDEKEWLGCADPQRMLEFLRGQATDRKLRLFACACCRRVWHVASPCSRNVVEVAEHFADKQAQRRELRAARKQAEAWSQSQEGEQDLSAEAALRVTERLAMLAAGFVSVAVRNVVAILALPPGATLYLPFSGPAECGLAAAEEWKEQVVLLRDLFGNPFRPVTINPAWLTPIVLSLAQASYDERNLPEGTLEPVRLALLADALEENGCTDMELLSHLRGPGNHWRGCFAVDAVLGRE